MKKTNTLLSICTRCRDGREDMRENRGGTRLAEEFMACMNVTDMEAMGAFMSSPEELQWDKDNGCVYKLYTMEEMAE